MDCHDDKFIPGNLAITFNTGDKVSYQRNGEKYSTKAGCASQLARFNQPIYEDFHDNKREAGCFRTICDKYAAQWRALDAQYKAAGENAWDLYTQENLNIDKYCEWRRDSNEKLWKKISKEMLENYQYRKKIIASRISALKKPTARVKIMIGWLRGTNEKDLLQTADSLESEIDFMLKRLESPEIKWESFLSHVQKDSGDAARNIKDSLLKKGVALWYDKCADRADKRGMIDGIINSRTFSLILTADYFKRPYCLLEYCVALVAGIPIIPVVEIDSRYGGMKIGSFSIPAIFGHIMKQELIEINRTYWDAFIEKLYWSIKDTPKTPCKGRLERTYSGIELRSTILKKKEIVWLADELGKDARIIGRRLFSTSKDGNTAEAFHLKCNNKGATLVAVESSEGKVFGGFTSKSWASTRGFVSDESAWLFKLREGPFIRIDSSDTKHSVYHGILKGPTFGTGCDLAIHFGDHSNNHCRVGSYSRGILAKKGKIKFQVEEYEVFEVFISPSGLRRLDESKEV